MKDETVPTTCLVCQKQFAQKPADRERYNQGVGVCGLGCTLRYMAKRPSEIREMTEKARKLHEERTRDARLLNLRNAYR